MVAVENHTACPLPVESRETLQEGDKDVHRGHVFACAQGVPGGGDEHQGSVPGVRVAQDCSNSDIGRRLNLSKFTGRNIIGGIRIKFGLKWRTELATFAVRHDLVPLD